MIDDLLPIGSVVRIKDVDKSIMIFGVKQKNLESEEVFDYIGVPFPEGNIGSEYQLFFNHKNIAEVRFLGVECQERDYFLNELKKVYEPENSIDIPDQPLEEELSADDSIIE